MTNTPEKPTHNEVVYKFDNVTVIISDEYIPKTIEEKRRNLKRFYDVCNQIAKNLEARGVDRYEPLVPGYPFQWVTCF